MTKMDLLIGGWVGVGQLLVAARQTVQCINNRGINGYDAVDDNAVQAQILYREQFPQKVVPNS
jgi:hypothetical protein